MTFMRDKRGEFTLWPLWGARPDMPHKLFLTRLEWEAMQGRWWTGLSRKEREWEMERG